MKLILSILTVAFFLLAACSGSLHAKKNRGMDCPDLRGSKTYIKVL